jgi:hypothetical protein
MAFAEKYTILCDDVRREDNGKVMVIGIYFGTITVPQLPFVMPALTFFQVVEADRPGFWNWRGKLQHLETGKDIFQAGGGLNIVKPGLALNVMRFPNVPLIAAGSYNFILEIQEQREPFIVPFDVVLNIPQQVQGMVMPGILPPGFGG